MGRGRAPLTTPTPTYHVITKVDGIERARTFHASIKDMYKAFGADNIVRFIPMDGTAWAEIHAIGDTVPDEEVYDYGIE